MAKQTGPQPKEHPSSTLFRLAGDSRKLMTDAGEILADRLSRELAESGLYAEFEITLTARIMDPEQADPVGEITVWDPYVIFQNRNPSRDDGTE